MASSKKRTKKVQNQDIRQKVGNKKIGTMQRTAEDSHQNMKKGSGKELAACETCMDKWEEKTQKHFHKEFEPC